ncbi:MAG: glycosyltransferase family 2 protein [Bryobacteraceae bacterium]
MPTVTVIVPTLSGGPLLDACLDALARQSIRDFEAAVVDNGGSVTPRPAVRLLTPGSNLGFGGAINLAVRATQSDFVAVLNDDAVPDPHWLEALLAAAAAHPQAGMFASCVLLGDSGTLDSAGMLLCGDGTGKQRGHRQRPEDYPDGEVFFPSGSAALYRRAMLDRIGLFEEGFFLYGEDTDLGLRARWAGWGCRYVSGARVIHRYSQSAGAASLLKAYYVERNRLRVVVRNFPLAMLCRAPLVSVARYWHHAAAARRGDGAAAVHRHSGGSTWGLAGAVVRAHAALAAALPSLWRERRALSATRSITAAEFTALADRFAISARDVAAQ